ncbi:MAG TPA: PEP-CTERM sorting domain-containing protein [Fimbriimonadaceae bacterium]|nr:PEP-CTERM sorting domain-containing protein [Fimbriimonadaceae bacterium]
MKTHTFHRGALAAILIASVAVSHAGVTLVGGSGTAIGAPGDMKYFADAYGVNTINYWTERENHSLANDLVVSILPPNSFPTNSTSHFNNNDNVVAAGTAIDSYYFYFDPVDGSAVGRFRFDRKILGVITNERTDASNDHFILSDYLINPLVPNANKAPGHFNARGLEIGSNEFIRWHNDREITLNLNAASPGDQIRVVTEAVPEPASIAALGLGLAALLRRRAKR